MQKTTFALLFLFGMLLVSCSTESLNGDVSLQEIETRSEAFPDLIPLPNGFAPEGIASGNGTTFYAGSLADGTIIKGDYRSGVLDTLLPPWPFPAVGMDFDPRSGLLFVAGGPSGMANVIDTRTGEVAASYNLNGGFVNDVIVTRQAAYFTDSFRPVYYSIPLGAAGRLPDAAAVQEIALGGDFEFVTGNFNSNGIVAYPPNDSLILINSALGTLYRLPAGSGEASLIDLGGDDVASGDGLLLDGKTLYVVQNFLNRIAVVDLSSDYGRGVISDYITSPDFRIPTTVAEHGNSLYAVNARFDVAPPGTSDPAIEFEVVKVSK